MLTDDQLAQLKAEIAAYNTALDALEGLSVVVDERRAVELRAVLTRLDDLIKHAVAAEVQAQDERRNADRLDLSLWEHTGLPAPATYARWEFAPALAPGVPDLDEAIEVDCNPADILAGRFELPPGRWILVP